MTSFVANYLFFWKLNLLLGHDEMILCLSAAHASTFNIPVGSLVIKSARKAFLVSFLTFYLYTFLATF